MQVCLCYIIFLIKIFNKKIINKKLKTKTYKSLIKWIVKLNINFKPEVDFIKKILNLLIQMEKGSHIKSMKISENNLKECF